MGARKLYSRRSGFQGGMKAVKCLHEERLVSKNSLMSGQRLRVSTVGSRLSRRQSRCCSRRRDGGRGCTSDSSKSRSRSGWSCISRFLLWFLLDSIRWHGLLHRSSDGFFRGCHGKTNFSNKLLVEQQLQLYYRLSNTMRHTKTVLLLTSNCARAGPTAECTKLSY